MVTAACPLQSPRVTAHILDLTARRSRTEHAVARVAAQPVRHVTPAFISALLCLDSDSDDASARGRVLRLAR